MNHVGIAMFWTLFTCQDSLALTITGGNDSVRGACHPPHGAKRSEGTNKDISPQELIDGSSFLRESCTASACVTVTDLLNWCYSNRYQNIVMWWNAGWNIIATSQQTETSWDNCIAKVWTDSAFRWHFTFWVLSSKTALFGTIMARCYRISFPLMVVPSGYQGLHPLCSNYIFWGLKPASMRKPRQGSSCQ